MADPRFQPVSFHTCAMPLDEHALVGLSLQPGNLRNPESRLRFSLLLDDAERMALAVLEAVAVQRYRSLSQQLRSSGMPSVDGSTAEGHAE